MPAVSRSIWTSPAPGGNIEQPIRELRAAKKPTRFRRSQRTGIRGAGKGVTNAGNSRRAGAVKPLENIERATPRGLLALGARGEIDLAECDPFRSPKPTLVLCEPALQNLR